jgi:hypothetical protein
VPEVRTIDVRLLVDTSEVLTGEYARMVTKFVQAQTSIALGAALLHNDEAPAVEGATFTAPGVSWDGGPVYGRPDDPGHATDARVPR